MKSYLVVGILGMIMVAVYAMPHPPPNDPPNYDQLFEWLQNASGPKKPIPSFRVERDLDLVEGENERVSYSLDALLHSESDRKGGETRSEAREYLFPDGSVAFRDFIV